MRHTAQQHKGESVGARRTRLGKGVTRTAEFRRAPEKGGDSAGSLHIGEITSPTGLPTDSP